MDELLFIVLNVWVVDSPTDESFQRADGILEVCGLLSLCCFADGSLFRAKRDERARWMVMSAPYSDDDNAEDRSGHARCCSVGDFVCDDVDSSMPGYADLGVIESELPSITTTTRGRVRYLAGESSKVDTDDGHGE
jgi:hypothetical protein